MTGVLSKVAGIFGMICLLSVHPALAQKNIKDFNMAERPILQKLADDHSAMVGIPFNLEHNEAWSNARIKSEITIREQLINECEKRIQACKSALATLPDAPSAEVTENGHLREYTQKVYIDALYPDLIRDLKNQIKQLQEGLNQRTESKTTSSDNTTSQSAKEKDASNDDFWSDRSSSSKAGVSSTSGNSPIADRAGLEPKDDNFKTAAQFKGGLDDVKEGDYFEDSQGNYYQKARGGARKVDKATYDRHAANKIYKQMERQEAERQQREAEFQQNWENVSTSFYAMSATKEDMRNATDLSGHFESIEALNAAFAQKMREISSLGNQLQQSSTQAAQAYAQAIGTGSTGYDYSGMTSAIGGVAAAIAASKAEKEAREELQRQRAAQEAKIKATQLEALVAMRTEINKVFTEGGMPLSSHKIAAPVLYMFAYSSNRADWNKNQAVAMAISNVIPVYRYSDGTYPYTSNVKRTFENAGMSNPIIIGYFTNQDEAETYRSSLLDIAPEAKFAVQDVAVQVKERPASSQNSASSSVDFWGIKSNGKAPVKTESKGKQPEVDFWGMPVKGK